MKTVMTVVSGAALLAGSYFPLAALAKQQQVDERIEVPTSVTVNVNNMRGEVTLIGGEGNYAEVKGKLDEYATGFTFELNGNTLNIVVEMPERGNFRGDEATDLTVRLPASAQLDINGVSSDFEVKGFERSVRVNTVSGDIEAENLAGTAQLTTVSGDIEAEGLSGEVTMKTVSGDIEDVDNSAERVHYTSTSGDIEVASSARDVRLETVSGDVEARLQQLDRLQMKAVSGDLIARLALAKDGKIEANSVSGGVLLHFADAVHAKLNAEVSGGGSIINNLSDVKAEEPRWGAGARLQTSFGDGSGRIDVSTMSGDIQLDKK